MSTNLLDDLLRMLEYQLNPHGYTGHLSNNLKSKSIQLENLISQTALMHESNSVLIIGPSGSGKTALLECVLEKTFKDPAINKNMLHVTLDGSIHTDETIILEDIAQQLQLSEVEDKHFGNFFENLQLLFSTLRRDAKTKQSVLLVLTKFELFATSKNTTLLSSLVDIYHSQDTPICIVGLCSQPDVLQAIQNQVNSEFSLQEIHLGEDVAFKEYLDSANHFLSLNSFKNDLFKKNWNTEIGNLFNVPTVKSILEHHYHYSCNLRDLKDLLHAAVQNMNSSQPRLTEKDFEVAYIKCHENQISNIILGLTVLEVILLVGMINVTQMYNGKAFDFEIIYDEVNNFLQNIMKWKVGKNIIRKAFENLVSLELVKKSGDYIPYNSTKYVLLKQINNIIEIRIILEKYLDLPAELKNWRESSVNPLNS